MDNQQISDICLLFLRGGIFMQEKKIDRRVRKTKSNLLRCLTELMSKKKINDITVKELTDLADVNRSTFYLYYKDIFDMVDQVETQIIDDFNEVFEKLAKEGSNYTNLLSFYTYIFEYVKSNTQLCKILFGPNGDSSFIEKFKNAINKVRPPFSESIPQTRAHYLRPFIIGGCISIIQQWLHDDMNLSPEEMAAIISEMTVNSCK